MYISLSLYLYIYKYIYIVILYIWWFPEIGVPPAIIHFQMGFSLTKTNQLLGYPHDELETPTL